MAESISGAIVKYGETFNAEGLAESITTTTQMGEVTGQLMDLIEKEGVKVDDFNAKLQGMSSVADRAAYIQDLLGQKVGTTFSEFTKANAVTFKAKVNMFLILI